MHWSEKIAREIIEKKPNKDIYVCAAGISPSGSVHIGNFRDVATSYFVAKSLRKLGKKVLFLFSWDDYDRFRKVPKNIEAITENFSRYIGLPYSNIPDPFNKYSSYAEFFEKEFEEALTAFGIEVDFKYQAKEYRKGRYSEDTIYTLSKRHEIYDIIMEFKTQDSSSEEKENYYPVSVYCAACGKDNTTITSLSSDCAEAEYTCKCGYSHKISFKKDTNYKLVWKLDWPMRWRAEGVDFEPGGKDHASVGGSFQVSSVLSSKIYNYEPPVFQGYEFIGIKGSAGKMSGSTGLNIIPSTLLKIYQPEIILWLYSKTDPMKAFDFCFDEEILRQYHEFDKMYTAAKDGSADDYIKDIMYYANIENREINTVPIAQLVNFGSIVNWNTNMLEILFKKIGDDYTENEFSERLSLAKYWLEFCSPESVVRLREDKDIELFNTLEDSQKQMVKVLYDGIKNNTFELDEMNTFLYSIPQKVLGELTDKEKKSVQAKFFEIIYRLLIGKTKGPRMYLFLMALDKNSYIELLNF